MLWKFDFFKLVHFSANTPVEYTNDSSDSNKFHLWPNIFEFGGGWFFSRNVLLHTRTHWYFTSSNFGEFINFRQSLNESVRWASAKSCECDGSQSPTDKPKTSATGQPPPHKPRLKTSCNNNIHPYLHPQSHPTFAFWLKVKIRKKIRENRRKTPNLRACVDAVIERAKKVKLAPCEFSEVGVYYFPFFKQPTPPSRASAFYEFE